MKHQAYRPIAMMLGFLLAVSAPAAQADTIKFADVVHVNADERNGRPSAEVRLRTVASSSMTAVSGVTTQGTASGSPQLQPAQQGSKPTATSAPTNRTGTVTLTNTAQTQDSPGNVETIELGEVTGTICDCGEIPAAGGFRFPKLPLLALGAIPLAFLDFGDNIPLDIPPFIPSGAPEEVPIPEPATLLLFGSGLVALGAKARRRHARVQRDAQMTSGEEG